MMEKLKAFGQSAKNVVIFVFTPVLFIIIFILHYISERNSFKEELERNKLGGELEKDKVKQEDIDAKAKESQDDYDAAKRAYNNKYRLGDGSDNNN